MSVSVLASPAHADSYTSYLVRQLRHDPVYISSYSSMAQPGDAAQIKRLLARLPVKTYVIADVAAGPDGEMQDSDLAALLHDQLGDGLFIFARHLGDVSATGFGTSLPVSDAMSAASFQLPGYPTLVQLVQRFVPIVLSGHTEQQLTAGERKVQQEAHPAGTPAWQVAAVTAAGAVLGGGATLALLVRGRRRRRIRRRLSPGGGHAGAGVAGTLGIVGLLALHPAGLAHSTAARPAPADRPPDGAAVAASALSSAPLYVDPDMAWMFTPKDEKRITAALRASPVPVFVVAAPFSTDEDSSDYASYFTGQLYGRTHRAGVYLTVGPSGDISDNEYRVPRSIDLPLEAELEPVSKLEPAQIAASVPGRVLELIAAAAKSPPDPKAAGLPQPQYSPGEFAGGRIADDNAVASRETQSTAAADLTGGGVAGLVLLGPLLALLGFAATGAGRRLVAARRGWGDADDPGIPVGRMPAAPSAGWLRRHARGELAELSRLIDAGSDANPGWERALDDYDAGKLVSGDVVGTGSGPDPVDLVGAIVLARDGRMALERQLAAPPPPCLVNPLHGRATTVLRRDVLDAETALDNLLRRVPGGQVPVCDGCRRAASTRRYGGRGTLGARVLRVPHHGQLMKYVDFGSVWRDRMFGASGPGLPQAVREHLGVS